MITIVSAPKPCIKKFRTIQENALGSWKQLSVEVMLFGNDWGVAQAAKKYGFRHIAKVKKNKQGTPLLSDIFAKAQQKANNPIIAYVNTDVVLMNDFVSAVKKTQKKFDTFLLIAKRHNMELQRSIQFSKNWDMRLKKELIKQGRERSVGNSSEFFVFPKSLQLAVPPFAIGRLHWDSWLIYRARFLHVPVIDATRSIFYIHHIHDYTHHKKGFSGVWYGEEAKINYQLAGGEKTRFKVTDSDWILTKKGFTKPPVTMDNFIRRFRVFTVIYPQYTLILYPLYLVILVVFKIIRIIQVVPRMNLKRVIETFTKPGLLEYKLKEL